MSNQETVQNIQSKAKEIRRNSLKAVAQASSGHPGGSLSAADILATLYFSIMKHDAKNPSWEDRDYLVVSKGHISPAIYSSLALAGYFEMDEFVNNFRQINQKFQGHIDRLKVPGVEVSTGSLGHGLSVANGIALGLRLENKSNRVFALLSDGEVQEGQTWEAIMAAAHYKIGNVTLIIDRNRIQLDGYTESTMGLDPLDEKLKAFGWDVSIIDGHNVEEIHQTLSQSVQRANEAKPHAIIANTIKGKGVSFMEDQVGWHGVAPKAEELEAALKELV